MTRHDAAARQSSPLATPRSGSSDPADKTGYAIYTFERDLAGLSPKWDLHATAENQDSAILHARMLALQPQFVKVQVQKIAQDPKTGEKTSKTIKIFQKSTARSPISSIKNWFLTVL